MKKSTLCKLLQMFITVGSITILMSTSSKAAYTPVTIDANNFPDKAFRTFVKTLDTNGNDILDENESFSVTEIKVSGLGIKKLSGLKHFPNLELLDCKGNQIQKLNLNNNNHLRSVECEKCKYCEKLKKTTKIPKVNKIELSSYEMTYNGKKQKPKVTLKDTAGKEIATFFYSVKESSSAVKVGTYRLNVSLNGFYQGDKSVAYRIVPKGTKIASIKSDKKAFILNWKKQTTQVDGYEIQYSTSEKFAASTTKKLSIKKDSTISKKVKNLKAKKKYYVRIRTYKKVN